ncbi:hypothetical protein LEMLEM_LOCUS18251, partial [Lemmus lemmus]
MMAQEVCCEIVSPCNIRSCTHKVSPTCLPKCELNKGDPNEHAELDREELTKPQAPRLQA